MSVIKLLYVFYCWFLHENVYGLVFQYSNEAMPDGAFAILSKAAMFSKDDAPRGRIDSYIKVNLTIVSNELLVHVDDEMEVIVYPMSQGIMDIGIRDENGDLEILCDYEKSEVVIPHIPRDAIYRYKVKLSNSDYERVNFQYKIPPSSTSLYALGIGTCMADLGGIQLQGNSIWMNPYGHLPGNLYALLPFYMGLSILYIILGLFYGVTIIQHKNDIMYIQKSLMVIILISIIEYLFEWFSYHQQNNNRDYQTYHDIAIACSILKIIIFKFLILCVAIGFGLTTKLRKRDYIVMFIFFISYTLWLTMLYFDYVIIAKRTEMIIVIVFWVIYWLWVFVSLFKSFRLLRKIAGQTPLDLDKKKIRIWALFGAVLLVNCFVGINFQVYQLKYVLKKSIKLHWRYSWLIEEGAWKIIFTLTFIILLKIWWPFKQFNKLIAVRPLTDEDFEDMQIEQNQAKQVQMAEQNVYVADDDDLNQEIYPERNTHDSGGNESTKISSAIDQ